jgi:cytochrome c oxidase assembly protein subunit 15
MLLLGALLGAALLAAYRPKLNYARDNFTTLTYVTATLSLIIILTGALVRGAGATLACFDWPLCNGSLLPFDQGPLQIIHWLHRAAVLGLGIALALLVWQAWRSRPAGAVHTLSAASAILFLTQAGIGALFVFSAADEVWGAAHVAFAALTWASLVALAVVDTINTTEIKTRAEWQLRSSAAGD